MSTTPEEERLSAELDDVSPFDLGCEVETDPETGLPIWFRHPRRSNVYAKLGETPQGRLLRMWVLVTDEREDAPMLLLSAKDMTGAEKAYYINAVPWRG